MTSWHRMAELLAAPDRARLEALYAMLEHESRRFLGYPCNRVFDYADLHRFLAFPLNNVGDPYVPSNYHLNTHDFERDVLTVFEELTKAPAGETWGYVTNGGTEGNHYGLFLARELHPDGIFYYSQDAHYSIGKVLRCLGVSSIMIRSRPDGSMDLDDLRETLRIHRDAPPVVCATIGTTMKGAVDDIAGIRRLFADFAFGRHYLHADAALGGMILPFADAPPPWNFADGVDSIAISGHKMVGSPIPCGVVLAKKQNVDRISQTVEYIGTLDTTLSGSRNGHTPLFLWHAFRTVGIEGFRRIIPNCLAMADYAVERLSAAGLSPWRHPHANTVVFDRPSAEVTNRWQLACQGRISHVITMPHVTRTQIDSLVADIERSVERPAVSVSVSVPLPAVSSADESERDILLVGAAEEDLLDEVSQALAAAGISIEGLTALTVDEGNVVRLRVSDRERAVRILDQFVDAGREYGSPASLAGEAAINILRRADFRQAAADSILVRLDDRAGALAGLTHQCHEAGIRLRSVRILWRGKAAAVVELNGSDTERLRELLGDRVVLN